MRFLFISILSFLCTSAFSQSWKAIPAQEEAQKRHENSFIQVGKKFLLIGGRGEKQIDIYHTETQKWSKGAKPPLEIHHSQAVSLDGLIYIMGAFTGNWPDENPVDKVLIYDPLENLWIEGPKIPADRKRGAAGVAIKDKKIYMVNGIINGHQSGWVNWFDEFDPYKNTWTKLPDSPHKRDHFQAIITADLLFVAGGRKSGSEKSSGFAGTVAPTDIYNFEDKKWISVAEIPTPRAGTSIGLINSNPVIIGGESDSQENAHQEVEIFNLEKGTWKALPEMIQGRHGTQAITLNEQILIGAGSGKRGGGPELNSFEIYTKDNRLNFSTESVLAGELRTSEENLNFSKGGTKSLKISNRGGNQAIVITEISISEGFHILNKRKLPFILAPRSDFELKIQGKLQPGELRVKSAGKTEPLIVKLNKKE